MTLEEVEQELAEMSDEELASFMKDIEDYEQSNIQKTIGKD